MNIQIDTLVYVYFYKQMKKNHSFVLLGPWSQWADYGDCYETKDYPRRCVKKQKRYCNCPSYCPPSCSKIEYRIVDCPDAYWLSWGPWSKCDVTCGVGTKKRVRICKKYCPNQKCPGSAYETMTCSEKPCCECGK